MPPCRLGFGLRLDVITYTVAFSQVHISYLYSKSDVRSAVPAVVGVQFKDIKIIRMDPYLMRNQCCSFTFGEVGT